MKYIALKNQIQKLDNYSIVPLREIDILPIKEWRNSQMDVLRQKRVLTDEGQKEYYLNSVRPLFNSSSPSQILFSYLIGDCCIGYGGLTNMDWESKRAELSYLVNNKRISDELLYAKEFAIFIALVKKVIFDDLNFNRVFTETYNIRPMHIAVLEQSGFKLEGIMKEHNVINNKFVDSLIHGFLRKYYA